LSGNNRTEPQAAATLPPQLCHRNIQKLPQTSARRHTKAVHQGEQHLQQTLPLPQTSLSHEVFTADALAKAIHTPTTAKPMPCACQARKRKGSVCWYSKLGPYTVFMGQAGQPQPPYMREQIL
jgi:hypothetical protein